MHLRRGLRPLGGQDFRTKCERCPQPVGLSRYSGLTYVGYTCGTAASQLGSRGAALRQHGGPGAAASGRVESVTTECTTQAAVRGRFAAWAIYRYQGAAEQGYVPALLLAA